MIDHVGLEVSDLRRSAAFYDAMLRPIGWRRCLEEDDRVGWGLVEAVLIVHGRGAQPAPGFGHVCIAARGVVAVRAAWEAGLEAGATDDGPPAQRPELGPSYFSAYLLDPDGYRIEIRSNA